MKQEFTWWHLMIACLFVRTFAIQNHSKCECWMLHVPFIAAKKNQQFFFIRYFCFWLVFYSFNRLIYWTQCSEKGFSFVFFSNKLNRFVQTRAQRDFYCSGKVFEMLLFYNCSFRWETFSCTEINMQIFIFVLFFVQTFFMCTSYTVRHSNISV